MKSMKQIRIWAAVAILLTLLCLCTLPCFSEDTVTSGSCGAQANWSLNHTTGELVISGKGDMYDYSLMNVSPWFSNCNTITSITVGEGVTSVGSYAFLYCTKLTSVSLPDSLVSVNGYAFSNCQALTEIDLGDGITTLGNGAFMNCVSLRGVDIPDTVTSIPNDLFSGCAGLTAVELPASLTSIGSGAFQNCASLAKVSLPASLRTVGANAFKGCSALTEMILPEGVTSVGSQAFSSCAGLRTLSLPRSLTELGDSVIAGAMPQTVLFNGTEEEWAAVSVGSDNVLLTNSLIYHPDHVFDRQTVSPLYLVSDADCLNAALYRFSCVCGEAGDATFTVGDPLGHMGGEASCHTHAVCDRCQQAYGELKPHTPDGTVDCTTDVRCTVCDTLLESALGHTEGPAATCTTDQICTLCGEVLTPRLEHDYTAEVTLEPTCTEAGVRTHTCSRCNHTYDEAISPAGHTEGAAATCIAPQTCAVCNTVLAEKLGHDYRDTVTAPTCIEPGHTRHTCSRCEYVYLDSFTSPVGHTDGPAATCSTPQFCTVCYAVLAERLGHDYRETVVAPTCIEFGHTRHACSRCEHIYLDTFTTPVGHTPGDKATCTEAQLCTVCEAVVTDKLGHDYRDTVTAPTCTEQGYISHVCARCDLTYRDSYTSAAGHTHGEAATCTAPQLCTTCQIILVPAIGHIPGGEATCAAPQTCTTCQAILAPATAHDYTDETVVSTCVLGGYVSHTCKACGEVVIDGQTQPLGHTAGPEATCIAPQTCTVCHVVMTDVLGHAFTAVEVAPTCTTEGQVTKTCGRCGYIHAELTAPATGHAASDWIIDNQPDVGKPGRQHKTCEVCDALLERETFWEVHDSDAEEPTDPDPNHPDAEEDSEEEDEGGCRVTGGNILVVVIILLAALLLWFLDLRRR